MSAYALTIASSAFLALALILHGMGWLTRDLGEDLRIRRGLDTLFARLDNIPLRDLAYRFLRRFQNRWETTFGRSRAGLVRFVLLSFAINIIAGSALIVLSTKVAPIYVLAPDELEKRMMWAGQTAWLTALLALGTAVAGLVVDLCAKSISAALLRFALGGTHLVRLLFACAADAAVLLAAYVLSWVIGGLIGYHTHAFDSFSVTQLLRMFVLPIHALAAALSMPFQNSPFFPSSSGALAGVISIQLLGASFQTAVYFVLGCCALAARLCPRPMQRVLARCVFQVTTDKKPVFSQLAAGSASFSAVFAALAGLAKFR